MKSAFLSEISSVFGYRLIIGIIVFISDILLARLLGVEFKGYYYFLITLIILSGYIGGIGLDFAINQLGHKNRERLPQYLLISSFIGVLIMWLIATFIIFNILNLQSLLFANITVDLSAIIVIAFLIVLPIHFLFETIIMATITLGNPVVAVKARLLRRALFAGAIFFLILADMSAVKNLVYLYHFQYGVMLVAITYLLYKSQFSITSGLLKSDFSIITEGLKSYPARIGIRTQARVSGIMLGIYATGTQLGFYSVAIGIGEVFFLVSSSVANVLFSKNQDEHRDKHLLASRFMIPVGLITAILIWLFSYIVVPLFYGEAFRESLVVLAYILPGVIFVGATQSLMPLLNQSGLTGMTGVIYSITTFIAIMICYRFIPVAHQGGVVAAGAYSISFASSYLLILLIASIRYKSFRIRDVLYPTKEDIKKLKQRFGIIKQ